MTKPRDPAPTTAADPEASGFVRLVEWGKAQWAWAERQRPFRALSRFGEVGGAVLAAGMSYQALFAVFAALYIGFGFSGVWLSNRPDLLDQLVTQINLFVPGLLGSEDAVVDLQDVLASHAVNWTNFVAGVSLLWVAITWFTGTRRAIRITFALDIKQYRNAILLKLRDLALALGFFVAIILSAALTLLSSNLVESIVNWLGWDADSWFVGGLGVATRYVALYVFDVLVLMGIHYFLAEIRVGKWALLYGCMLGGAALFVLKLLGTLLLGGASNNPLLATFAVLIGLLIWFNLICRALLLTSAWIAVGQNPKLGLPES